MSDDVHFFDGPGIEEGNGSVPRWFIGFIALLFVVIVAYLGVYLVNAQPSSARMLDKGAATAGQPTDGPAEGTGDPKAGE